jgi:hypothetical protein
MAGQDPVSSILTHCWATNVPHGYLIIELLPTATRSGAESKWGKETSLSRTIKTDSSAKELEQEPRDYCLLPQT